MTLGLATLEEVMATVEDAGTMRKESPAPSCKILGAALDSLTSGLAILKSTVSTSKSCMAGSLTK